jgi:flagellar hook-associated protein 2
LSQLGISTQKDGTLKVDGTVLKGAISDDLDGVVSLFAGSAATEGLSAKLVDYLESVTDRSDGILASRKTATDSGLRRLDSQIERQEARLEQREETLRAQFTAMEQLVSSMNATSSYLSQLPSLAGGQ